MRFLLGFLSGLAAAWTALAIWQRVPALGPIDADDEYVWEPRRGDRRPGFDASAAYEPLTYEEAIGRRSNPAWPPAPVTDPAAHTHDRYCRYPMRPCVCTVTHPITGGIGAP